MHLCGACLAGAHPAMMPVNAAGMEADDLAASLMMPQVTQWSPPKRRGMQAAQAAPPAGLPLPGGLQQGPQQVPVLQPGQARGLQQQSPPHRIQGEQMQASSWPAQASPGRSAAAQQEPVGRRSVAQQAPHNTALGAAPQPQQEQPRWVDFGDQESGPRSSGLRPAGPEPARRQAGSSRPASPQPWAAGSHQRGGVPLPVWAGSGRSDSPPWASQLQAGPLPGAGTWQGAQQQTSTGAQPQVNSVRHVSTKVQVTEPIGTSEAQLPAAEAAELQVGSTQVCRLVPPARQVYWGQAGVFTQRVRRAHACCAALCRLRQATVCLALPEIAHEAHPRRCSGHVAGQQSGGPTQQPQAAGRAPGRRHFCPCTAKQRSAGPLAGHRWPAGPGSSRHSPGCSRPSAGASRASAPCWCPRLPACAL